MLDHQYEYDVVVVGGGSGGLACAREAAALGLKVLVADFVNPSWQGTTWGLGGTCVNVGCIPKKLMHHAAQMNQVFADSAAYGWELGGEPAHSWATLRQSVQDYIRGSNFGYRSAVRTEGIEYVNAPAAFDTADPSGHSVVLGAEGRRVTAQHVVLAVGGRPTPPTDAAGEPVPGHELCITSDDLFSLEKPPGRTLVVGGGYIALEATGLLQGLGMDTSLLIRSRALRSFDKDLADKVLASVVEEGASVCHGAPLAFAAQPDGSIKATVAHGDEVTELEGFDTVLLATGRRAVTGSLGAASVGVELDAAGRVQCHRDPGGRGGPMTETSTGNRFVHAIGDCARPGAELTPVASKQGERLARRLAAGLLCGGEPPTDVPASMVVDYRFTPTAVFSPAEYGTVGLSESDAQAALGAEDVECFHLLYDTLEEAGAHRVDPGTGLPRPPHSYSKVVVQRSTDRVVGLHVVGPAASEVVQGFALAMRLGATKADFDDTIGVHPTHSEVLVGLNRPKRPGVDFVKTGC